MYTGFHSALFTLITSGSSKTGSLTISLLSAYANGVPKLLLGTYRIDCAAGTILDYNMVVSAKTASSFGISYTVGASTVINVLKISYLTIDNTNSAMTTYDGGIFHGVAVGTSNIFAQFSAQH